MQSVFLLADDAAQVGAGPPRNPKAGRGSKLTGRGAAAAGRSSQQGDRKQSSVSTANSTSKPSGTSTTQETRTCRGCFVKGHLYRNCPDNPDRAPAEDTKIMIAAGEDDTADEDVYDSAAFMITDSPETTRDRDSNRCSSVQPRSFLTIKKVAPSSKTDPYCPMSAMSHHSTSVVSTADHEACVSIKKVTSRTWVT
jgi:hypothetical protein